MSNLKRFLSLTLAMLMVVGAMATVSAKSFTDVAATDPYAEAVDVLSELGVIAGATTTEFAPDALVERQQMAMFIARLATAKPAWFAVEAAPVYADQTAPVYNAAIAYANTNGIIVGRTATSFDGAASVNLQEAATMMCRALGYYSNAMNAAYPMSYLMMADDLGLLAGLDDVAPTAALTRGEVAIMLYNAFDAKMAVVTPIYGPNGVDRIVEIPSDDAKYLSINKWNCTTTTATITATQKLAIGTDGFATTTKAISDPVTLNCVKTSFASISKFFASGTTAEDLLGVELSVLKKGDTILKIDVVGSTNYPTDASVTDGVVKVNGTSYDLVNYPSTDLALGDNCFYIFSGNKLISYDTTKAGENPEDARVAKTAAEITADFVGITNGFYSIEIINDGLASQKIIYKPLSLGKVIADGIDADTEMEIETIGNITVNEVGAMADNYVTYFNGGSNMVEIYAVASVTTNDKVMTINSNGTATLASGMAVPTAATALPGNGVIALSNTDIGAALNVYQINNTVVKTEVYSAAAAAYTPKSYYKVLDVANRIASSDGFTTTYTYKIQVVNDAGTVSAITVTHINDEELATVAAVDVVIADDLTVDDWDTVADGLLTGKLITVVGQKIYTALSTANFFADANESVVETPVELAKVLTNVYTVEAGTNAILVDTTKILVFAEGDSVYKTFHGKTLTAFDDDADLANIQAIVRTNGTVTELVYYTATSAANSADLLLGDAPSTALPELYLFEKYDSITATSISYVGFNLATGTRSLLMYNNPDATVAPTPVTDIAATSDLYLAGGTAPDTYATGVSNVTGATLHTLGYLVDATNLYTTNDTKYYTWDAATSTYIPTTIAVDTQFDATILVEGTNVTYVIVRPIA